LVMSVKKRISRFPPLPPPTIGRRMRDNKLEKIHI